jgi:GNAT superfamily N-acetyltransferase
VAITVVKASTAEDRACFEQLVLEYVASLPFSLDFQHFEEELAGLAQLYGPPAGCALVAKLDGEPVGCAGIRALESGIAELKRMYVRPEARRCGAGRALTEAALAAAGRLGYDVVRLDTTTEMVGAMRIYERLGFAPIAAYRYSPLDGARFYEVRLGAPAGDRTQTHAPQPETETPDA